MRTDSNEDAMVHLSVTYNNLQKTSKTKLKKRIKNYEA